MLGQKGKKMVELIEKQMALDALGEEPEVWTENDEYALGLNNQWHYDVHALEAVPPAQPETYKEKLNEIASALSEKFAYMNTCLNERDIILGYLGVKRCCETHCNTDCTNTKCESHPLSSAQPEQRWIPVTKDTLPEEGKVVIVKGLKGTWDFGTYRGFGHINGEENIHRWQWKKNTYKSVYWWMYKDGALPEPHREEGDE